ncbi:MAG TPA: hypothetical protein VEF76_08865 [Patescibacteria group bacterium]|nr:hypothetical protein [Patescibacteria group bacterium]
MMLEPAVTLTDFIVAFECAAVAWCLRTAPAGQMRTAFFLMFGGIGVGALAGGLVHGFFPEGETQQNLWLVVLASLGVMALAGWSIGALLLLRPKWAAVAQRAALAELVFYCWYISREDTPFSAALLNYLPATMFMLVGYIVFYRRQPAPPVLLGIAGLLLTFLGALLQSLKIGIHPTYFDHNALFHVVQFIAIYLIFLSAKHFLRSEE